MRRDRNSVRLRHFSTHLPVTPSVDLESCRSIKLPVVFM